MIIGADQTNSYSSCLVITLVLGWIIFRADEGNRLGVAGISVGMVDHEKAAPSPCKYRSRRRDYPQGKQREETGLAGKRAVSALPGTMAPAGQTPETPRHAGISGKKKGLETIQTLQYWWSRRESNPRPQVLYDQFYMRSRSIWISVRI